MKQAIVILLKDNEALASIRKKYEPNYKKYRPHVTLAFPFEDIEQEKLILHINNSIKNIKRFKLKFQGLEVSKKEFYLFLLVNGGRSIVNNIHKNLYGKLLGKWLRKDIPYVPHITLGVFKNKKEIDKAIKEKKICFKQEIRTIQLLTLKEDDSIKSIKNFKLG